MKNRKAIIFGIKGTKLNSREKNLLKKDKPWGVILFSRNIKNIKQAKNLVDQIKKTTNDKKYPILIDEEGGTVSRINKFIDTSLFNSDYFGRIYKTDHKKFKIYYEIYIKQISYLLKLLGININTVPVLDVKRKFTNKVLFGRTYSNNPKIVHKLGKLCIEYFHKHGIATVMKHIPGHGLARVDTHDKMSITNKNIKYLNQNDFSPFKNQRSIMAMTAHIIYSSIDKKNTATHSKKIIKIIRNKIGFKKIIITDDISMKSLKYSVKENTIRAFTAGCNLVLHCNGRYNEMINVAENSPFISPFVSKKTTNLINIFK